MCSSYKHAPARYMDIDEQLLNIFDATPVPMVLSRSDGSFEYVNPALAAMLGYGNDEIYSSDVIISHPDEAAINKNIRSRLKADPFSPVRIEKRYLHKTGRIIPGYLTIVAEPDNQGGIKRFISQIVDQSEYKRNHDQLLLASLVYKNSSEAMMVTDANNLILDINPAFTDITGFTLSELKGRNPNCLNSGRHNASFYAEIDKVIEQTGQWSGEIWNKRKNGEVFAEWQSIDTIYDVDGSVSRRVTLFTDLSKKKEAEALILQQANYDSLTGLPNRRLFLENLKHEIRKTQESGLSGALFIIDLDRFKEVNDALGHNQGDILLRQTGNRLNQLIRKSDFVARLSSDEFAIIQNDISSPQQVELTANDILAKLQQPFQLTDEQVFISASIGISLFPDDTVKAEQLLQNADQAMHMAKRAGQNRYQYFTPAMQQQAVARMSMVRELRYATERQQFELYYQPIVDLQTGKIIKAEALLRWHHPQNGLTSPAEFIPLAESTGLILRIGEWVFSTAARQLSHWQQQGHTELELSFNASPLQLKANGILPEDWLQQLEQLNVPAASMVIEITENLLIDNNRKAREVLDYLRQGSMKVAIDDFGTGYSSLAYLKDFDTNYLKIDQTFIRNLPDSKNDAALCEAMILMAHKLNMQVIAEGIETKEQKLFLTQAGCDFGQGWLYAKALPAAEFESLLNAQSRHTITSL
ncbi:sensor domain-containing protein [Amphritea japonica]|uniref:Signal transduction protein n=1 Tax=Amphritea japonica ATCC BAA-1530 TaxID=1278309 RepID=A0A7R6PQD8_9GAMM|nr:bifunctional diguanylate cyclase/phosphodiesterase [Amphritea japonica]BBB27598.1 signal transduction protein [Amphritea japonica ATCC BAA-1530]